LQLPLHIPSMQRIPGAQAFQHAPQWSASEVMSTQAPPQRTSGGAHPSSRPSADASVDGSVLCQQPITNAADKTNGNKAIGTVFMNTSI